MNASFVIGVAAVRCVSERVEFECINAVEVNNVVVIVVVVVILSEDPKDRS